MLISLPRNWIDPGGALHQGLDYQCGQLPRFFGEQRFGCLAGFSANHEPVIGKNEHICLWRYLDRILKGAKPGELPVQAPTKFDFTIIMTTAKALGLTLSPTMLALTDEVIE